MVRAEVITKTHKKMKTKYQILPFYASIKETSLFQNQALNNSLRSNFKVFTEFNRLIPFVCQIENDCNFEIIVRDYNGQLVGQITKQQIAHRVFTSQGKSYLVYFGDLIGCLELGECKLPYCLQIGNLHSEWFWVSDSIGSLLRFEIGNSSDFSFIPYSLGFKQVFYIESNLGTPEVDSFSVSNRDSKGVVSTTYQKLTETYNIIINNAPAYIKQAFQSFEVLDYLKLSYKGLEVICQEKQAKVTSKRNELGFSFFDIQLSIPSSDFEEIGVCSEVKFEVTNCLVIEASTTNCIQINAIEEVDINCDAQVIDTINVVDCEALNDILGIDIDCIE
jgi:hypothetical protein